MKSNTQFILPCADKYGNPMCYICGKYVSSVKDLYEHMGYHTDSEWRSILPRKPKKTSVSVRFTPFPSSSSSDQSSNVTINDEAGPSHEREVVDLMKRLSPWKVKDEEHPSNDEVLMESKGGGTVVFGVDLSKDPVMMMEDEA